MADKLITKVPENYEWEVHNLNAYADKKKALAEGKITELQLREFEYKYRESDPDGTGHPNQNGHNKIALSFQKEIYDRWKISLTLRGTSV